MNKTLKRILVTTLLIVMLNNFIFSNISFVYAEDDEADMKRVMGPIVSSVVGLLTLPIRLIAVFIGNAINRVTALVAYSQYPEDGTNDSDGKASTINPFDILFNKVQLVDINFFHIDNSKTIVNTIRKGVASWYYVMRLIATAILLVILVYVGIRMALSTVASEKATYKKMLFDWAMSLAIIYVLHYLIIFVLYLNDAIVSTLEAAAATDTGEVSAIIDALFVLSKKWMNINSIPATAVYCLLGWQTIGLLISYFNRMLKLAFLLIIAPLITITYSIDKMGDGKAQVLNRWLKEFIYTILIQPFHCIIYITLVSTSFKLMTSVATYTNGKANIPNAKTTDMIAAGILAILCIRFIKEAENLVRSIFNFQDQNQNTSLAAGAATAALAVRYSRGFGATAGRALGKGVTALRNAPSGIRNGVMDMKANLHAISSIASSGGKSFSQRKDEYYNNVSSRAEAREQELQQLERYKGLPEQKLTANKDKRSAEVAERTKQLMEQGMSATRAAAIARNEVSKRHYKANKAGPVGRGARRTISKVSGGYNKVRNAALDIGRNSYVLKSMGQYAKFSAAAATGVLAGTAAYSSGKSNIFTAFGAGVAAHKATSAGIDEYYKSTMGFFAGNVRNSLKSIGVSNDEEARSLITKIMANGDKYESDDELKDLVEAIKKELMAIGRSESEVANIRNQIETEIASGRPVNPEDIIQRLYGNSGQNIDGLKNATRNLSDFENEKNIYNMSKQATDFGISGDRFISSSVRSMTGSDFTDSRVNGAGRSGYAEGSVEQRAADESIGRSDVAGLSVEEKEKLQDELDRMLKSKQRELEGYTNYGIQNETLEKEVRRLEENKKAVDLELQKNYEENARDLVAQLSAAQRTLSEEEAESIARDTLDKVSFEIQLQQEFKRKVKEFSDMKSQLERDAQTLTQRELELRRKEVVKKQEELSIFSQNMKLVEDSQAAN